MKILVTGADGFIGKNLILFLKNRHDLEIFNFSRKNTLDELNDFASKSDLIFHLAGVNRFKNLIELTESNEVLTKELCQCIKNNNKKIPVIFSSSTQAELDNPYGISKKKAEKILLDLNSSFKNPIYIFRLPNVFGKFGKTNYNSVVTTFCYNISRDIPINIQNSEKMINLVYIDDVINHFIKIIDSLKNKNQIKIYQSISPSYQITSAALAKQIYAFKDIPNSNMLEPVGNGFVKALYSTYVSYLPKEKFCYPIKKHIDQRGAFMEMLKTNDYGQFSCFTVVPNMTRGNHYHHSKTEKFLVIKGHALFKFYNLDTLELYEKTVNSDNPEIVFSVPGWAHSITNIGSEEMTVMLWSNENFNYLKPDTYEKKI